MPNCFTLTRKSESEPIALATLDEELCALLNVPVDPRYYVEGWYDTIGFRLAVGVALDSEEMTAAMCDEPNMLRILAHLRENYTANAWAEIGRGG